MPYFVNDPCHWRERAKESRVLADTFTDPVARNNMLEVAAAYERMGNRAARPALPRPRKADSPA